MDTDELCVQFLIKTCTGCGEDGLRMVWIKNTLSLNEFYISEGLYKEAQQIQDMQADSIKYRTCFDKEGNFTGFIPCANGGN